MNASAETVKRVLLPIRARLRAVLARMSERAPAEMVDAVPELDRVLRRTFEELDELRRYLFLLGTPRPRPYDVLEWTRTQSAHSVRTADSLQPSRPERFVGDVERMAECLRLVLRNLAPLSREPLGTRVFLGGTRARLEVGFDDQAVSLQTVSLGPNLAMSLVDFTGCWSAATGGGRLVCGPEGVVLYLSGQEPPTPPDPAADTLHRTVKQAADCLAPWRGAIGHFEEGMVHNSELASLYAASVKATLVYIERVLGKAEL